MSSPKPMGPIERELRRCVPDWDGILSLDQYSWGVLIGARDNLGLKALTSTDERFIPDALSEAIEAAEALSL